MSAVGGLGLAAGAAMSLPVRPAELVEPVTATEVPVGMQPFDDARVVEVALDFTADTELAVGVSGRVTALNCSAGATLGSGASPVSVDGDPKVALSTAVPLWRDLTAGDTGPDVVALQGELARLGHELAADGRFGSRTLAAFNALLASVGSAGVQSFETGKVLWIPAAEVVLSSCPVAVGASIQQGQAVATTGGGLGGVAAELSPELVPGARALTLSGVTVPLDDDGRVSDAAALQQLVAAGVRPTDADRPSETTTATIALVTPIDILVVPPSSVVVDGARTCVYSGTAPVGVLVVGSQLGQTYVTVEGPPPQTVLMRPAETTCG